MPKVFLLKLEYQINCKTRYIFKRFKASTKKGTRVTHSSVVKKGEKLDVFFQAIPDETEA